MMYQHFCWRLREINYATGAKLTRGDSDISLIAEILANFGNESLFPGFTTKNIEIISVQC